MISNEKITEIVEKTDIVGLVSEYVTLSKRGKNYFGLCPFHDDQTPSFSVSPEKKIAKCMSCGEGGNPINFLKKIKNISFEDACYLLAERNGIHLEKVKNIKTVDINQKYYEINQIAQQFYEHYLYNSQSGKEALLYLNKRGLSMETIKMFGIGLAPKDHDTLVHVLKDKGYSLTDATDVGLIKSNKEGYYDVFYNRIMFPIIDENNHVLAFSGRIFVDDPNQPKYVNTEETVIYKKGEMLYNLNNAIPHIRKQGRVILCEGQLDVIALSNANIKEAICSLGTALTQEQVKLIEKYTKNVIISYDGDNAGIKATAKAFNLLKGFNANSLTLPDGMDPDEYIKKYGVNQFKDFLNNNLKDAYAFSYDNAFRNRDLSVAYDYEEVKKSVFNFLMRTKSSSLVEKYLRKLSIDLKVSYDAIFNDYNIYSKGSSGVKVVETPSDEKNILNNIKSHERFFIDLVAYDKKYFDYFNKELENVSEYIDSQVIFRIYQAISYFYNSLTNDQSQIYRYCINECNDLCKEYIYKMMERVIEISELDPSKIEKILSDCVNRFKEVRYKMMLKEDFKIEGIDVTEDTANKLEEKLKLRRKIEAKRK